MPAPVWLHCGDCSTRGSGRWFLSSCGRIVCSDCKPLLQVHHCPTCRGPCSRTVELTSRAPLDVKNLFTDPSDLIKPISKILDFQEKQKRSWLMAQTKRLSDLDAKYKEFLRRKEERMTAIEKARSRLAQLRRAVDEKKALLRNGDQRVWRSTDRPETRSSYNNFPNEYQNVDQDRDLFSTPKKNQDETYGVNDGGFLQLKTPGVFHGDRGDLAQMKDPFKKRIRTSTTSHHSNESDGIREKIRHRNKLVPGFFTPDYSKYDSNNAQSKY